MSPDRSVLLSKSRFLAGLQCLKRLYLDCHHRELADPVDATHQAVFDSGHAVGALARQDAEGVGVNRAQPGAGTDPGLRHTLIACERQWASLLQP